MCLQSYINTSSLRKGQRGLFRLVVGIGTFEVRYNNWFMINVKCKCIVLTVNEVHTEGLFVRIYVCKHVWQNHIRNLHWQFSHIAHVHVQLQWDWFQVKSWKRKKTKRFRCKWNVSDWASIQCILYLICTKNTSNHLSIRIESHRSCNCVSMIVIYYLVVISRIGV